MLHVRCECGISRIILLAVTLIVIIKQSFDYLHWITDMRTYTVARLFLISLNLVTVTCGLFGCPDLRISEDNILKNGKNIGELLENRLIEGS